MNSEKIIIAQDDYDGSFLNWSNKKCMVCFWDEFMLVQFLLWSIILI